MRHEVAAFGFDYSLAAAATATAAHVLSAQADGIAIPHAGPLASALGAVPLATSGLDADAIAALRGMGFRNLRDLFRLPRAELARRIGPDALDHLDRMRGLVAETLARYRPADRFERKLEFSFGIESQGALGFALQRLVRELATFLAARDGGVQRFTLVLGHERGASTRIEVGLIAPQRDAVSLFDLARARLERIELVAPVHALTLVANDLPPLCPLHVDLFDTSRREALDWPALIERLRARLGDEALRGLRCVADHRPSRAWRFADVDVDPGRAKLEPPPVIAAAFRKRPFWLLSKPCVLRGELAKILAGPRAHRKRLVGRARQAPRLLHRRDAARSARMGVRAHRIRYGLDAARLVRMKPLDPPKPRKPRRLRAPLEPGLPDPPGADDTDPRSALYKLRRRETIRTLCRDHYGTTGRIENRQHAKPVDETGAHENEAGEPACYAELHCLSNFSFQRGASSARELFERAKKLGYCALAITDECSLAGIVRALEVAEETKIALIVGTEVRLDDGPKLVLLARNQDGYSDICRLITTGRRRSAKGEYQLVRADAEALGDGVLVLWIPTGHERTQKARTHQAAPPQALPFKGRVGRGWCS